MRTGKVLLNVFLVLAVLISMAIAIAGQHANEDLYMSLCSGRDTAQGRLGQPDEWSYVTQGKIWVNQGWASGLIYYCSFVAFDALGPVLIKGILLTLTLVVCYQKCRRMGIETEVSLFAIVVGLLGMAPFLSIIAENFGILYLILLSSLLTMPVSYGSKRQWGCLLVMLLWANSHGSFMIGWVMIWIKVAAVAVNGLVRGHGLLFRGSGAGKDRSVSCTPVDAEASFQVLDAGDYAGEIRSWIWTAVGCLIVMAFANPFGIDNLVMPFRQSGSGLWTKEVLFWSPLVKMSETKGPLLYKGLNSVPFLIHLVICASLLCVVMATQRRKIGEAFLGKPQSRNEEDLPAETMIALFLVVLAFRFGRTIVFTAPALIPLTAYLFRQTIRLLSAGHRSETPSFKPILKGLPLLAAVFSAGLAALWFRFETLPPYFPSNPLVREQTLGEKILGPLSREVSGLTEFLRTNGMNGRICSSWQLADVLLWEVPGVRIFLDLRAQSVYSDKLREEYNAIFRVDPQSASSATRALSLLDLRQVRAVAIDKRLEPSRLPVVLSASRRWVPIYNDEPSLLYVRSDSREADCLLRDDDPNCVRYPDPALRALSLATMWLEMGRSLPQAIEDDLRACVVNRPSDLAYRAICIAQRRRFGSLKPETQAYLWSEYLRTARMNYRRPGGYAILVAREEILEQLKRSGYFSSSATQGLDYPTLREALSKEITDVWSSYLPWTKSRLRTVGNGKP